MSETPDKDEPVIPWETLVRDGEARRAAEEQARRTRETRELAVGFVCVLAMLFFAFSAGVYVGLMRS